MLCVLVTELGRQAFGAAGEYAVWFGVIAMTLGVCGTYATVTLW